MAFIICNQCMDFLSFTKQATFTPFVMDGIVGNVNINALLLQTVLYQKWGHAVMDDVIYRTKNLVLILIFSQGLRTSPHPPPLQELVLVVLVEPIKTSQNGGQFSQLSIQQLVHRKTLNNYRIVANCMQASVSLPKIQYSK